MPFRPQIGVHTHTAKVGIPREVGRVVRRSDPRPVIVHTYHGHVLEGYFGPFRKPRFYRFFWS